MTAVRDTSPGDVARMVARARVAVSGYPDADNDMVTALQDMMTDALHLVAACGGDPGDVAARAVRHYVAESAPCPGCNAPAGEPCRWGCLSTVTDDAGQPVDRDDTAGGE